MRTYCRKSCRRCHRGAAFRGADAAGNRRRLRDHGKSCPAASGCPAVGHFATCFPPATGAAGGGFPDDLHLRHTRDPKGVRRLDIGDDPAHLRALLMDKVFGIAPDRVVRTAITGPQRAQRIRTLRRAHGRSRRAATAL